MFHLFLRRMLQAFIWMLHMFHAYIVSVLSGCCMCLRRLSSVLRCFASVLNVCCECFRHMLQVFQLFSDVCYKWFYLAVANRLSVPCIAIGPICRCRLLQLLGRHACGSHVKQAWEAAGAGTGTPHVRTGSEAKAGGSCVRAEGNASTVHATWAWEMKEAREM
jgi:hypothetical protein